MLDLLSILIIILCFFTKYIVSLYALAVYIDPNEVEELIPAVSSMKRKMLLTMAGDARAFLQISEVYKSFTLIVITIFTVLLSQSIANAFDVKFIIVIIISLLFVWIFHIIIGEILPRYSSRKAINVGMIKHLWVIYPIYRLFFPIVKHYRRAIDKSASQEEVSEDEKEDIVERAIETVAEHAGISETIVDEKEKEMINQIFLLDQTVAKEIMIPRPDIIAFEKMMTFKEIREIIKKDGHSRYPVYDSSIDKIIGLCYVKDLFNKPPEMGEPFNISSYLRTPFLIPETKIIGELLQEFKSKRQHIAIVVDEYGGVAGLVTLEDIIEEIFGDIQDEHDSEFDDIIKRRDGRYKVNASLLVERLQDFLDTEYEIGNYDTVGGLMYDLFGSVPDEGQKVKWNDLEFEIEQVEGQRIISVIVRNKRENTP